MVCVIGDTHAEKERFEKLVQNGRTWDKEDVLIVCGDFGFIYSGRQEEHEMLDFLEQQPYQICFCDGNHENFDLLNGYPVEEWNGGKVHRVRSNIRHLMRGQLYEIEGKTFFVMGGAYSSDKNLRKEGTSWWAEEMPDAEDYVEAIRNLEACGDCVDYVITHTAPSFVVDEMEMVLPWQERKLTSFLDWVDQFVTYRTWFFGHWHRDETIYCQYRALWKDVVELP